MANRELWQTLPFSEVSPCSNGGGPLGVLKRDGGATVAGDGGGCLDRNTWQKWAWFLVEAAYPPDRQMAVESKPLFHPEVLRQQVRAFNVPERVERLF